MKDRWLEWFDMDDEADCQWALGYLIEAGESVPISEGPAGSRLNFLMMKWPARTREKSQGICTVHSNYRALETKMRAAYRNRKRRAAQKDQKTYSLIMKRSAQRPLSQLASLWGLKQNQAVEKLIFEAAELRREFDKQSKAEIQRAREDFRKKKEALQGRLKNQQEQIKALKQEIRELKIAPPERKVTRIHKRLASIKKPGEE